MTAETTKTAVVPVEPTEAMLVNGREALMPLIRLDNYGPLIGIWKDMLAAAPDPRANRDPQAGEQHELSLTAALTALIEADRNLAVAVNFCEPTARLDELMLAEGASRSARKWAEAVIAAIEATASPQDDRMGETPITFTDGLGIQRTGSFANTKEGEG